MLSLIVVKKVDIGLMGEVKIKSMFPGSKIKETEEFTMLENLYVDGVQPVKRENVSASIKGKANISNYLREILQEAEKEIKHWFKPEEIINYRLVSEEILYDVNLDGILE